jgi:hypothetical protein
MDKLHMAATTGNLDEVQGIAHGTWVEIMRSREENWVECDSSTLLGIACYNGHLGAAQWLCEVFDLTPRHVLEYALPSAIGENHLHVVQWLFSKFTLTTAESYDALLEACAGGHLEIVKWLYTIPKLTAETIGSRDHGTLREACAGGHIPLARWLTNTFSLTAQDARAGNNFIMRVACSQGCLRIIQWLHQTFDLGPNDINANDNCALKWAFCIGYSHVLQWICCTSGLTTSDIKAATKNLKCLGVETSVSDVMGNWTKSTHHEWYLLSHTTLLTAGLSADMLTGVLRAMIPRF